MSHQALSPSGSAVWPAARAFEPTASFWFAMYAASALGTNLGDYWADALSLGLAASFVSLAVISALLIGADRRFGAKTELYFWVAIVVFRAMATNVGDFLTDDVGIARPVSGVILCAATLAAGWITLGSGSPRIDARYWLAMFFGGAFGTIAGDFISHAVGLPLATLALAALLVVAVAARQMRAPAALLGYWIVVLFERTAGTPAGDLLAEERGWNYGLPVAMATTGAVFVLALILRGRKVLVRGG
jgi:uncharacterized membrane-anchored protein